MPMPFDRGKNFETNGKTALFDLLPNGNGEVTLLKNSRGDISILLQQTLSPPDTAKILSRIPRSN